MKLYFTVNAYGDLTYRNSFDDAYAASRDSNGFEAITLTLTPEQEKLVRNATKLAEIKEHHNEINPRSA